LGFGEKVAFSPDGRRLATGGEEHTITVWDAKTGEEQQTLRGHTGDVFAVAFDRHGRWLASAGEGTTVRPLDTTSSPWTLRHTLRGHTGFVTSLAFSPDSRRLASGSRDRTLRVWDLAHLEMKKLKKPAVAADVKRGDAGGGSRDRGMVTDIITAVDRLPSPMCPRNPGAVQDRHAV